MKNSLLCALRKYRPRDNSDPLENFITEAFAWLLQNHPLFGRFFLRKITAGLRILPMDDVLPLSWSTQMNFGGTFPDLVCETEGRAFIFEHKAWSSLHHNQLANYRAHAASRYGPGNSHLILIVGAPHQVGQDPDMHFCWRDVHRWVGEWQDSESYEADFLFGDFCLLLEGEGLGPPAPVSHEAIFAFKLAKGFEANLSMLLQRVSKYPWQDCMPQDEPNLELVGHHGRLWGDDKCGVLAICLLREGKDWLQGLSVGFVLETWNYLVEPLNPACPDFSIILDMQANMLPDYLLLPSYQRMRDDLELIVTAEAPDFDFHDHLTSHPEPNLWHPIHIRKPMSDLLRGTVTAHDQEQQLFTEASRIIRLVVSCPSYRAFRTEIETRRAAILQVGLDAPADQTFSSSEQATQAMP